MAEGEEFRKLKINGLLISPPSDKLIHVTERPTAFYPVTEIKPVPLLPPATAAAVPPAAPPAAAPPTKAVIPAAMELRPVWKAAPEEMPKLVPEMKRLYTEIKEHEPEIREALKETGDVIRKAEEIVAPGVKKVAEETKELLERALHKARETFEHWEREKKERESAKLAKVVPLSKFTKPVMKG